MGQFLTSANGPTALAGSGTGVIDGVSWHGIVLRPVQPDTVRIPLVMVWPAGRQSPALGPFLDP